MTTTNTPTDLDAPIFEPCFKCSGTGSVSWGVHVSGVVGNREIPQVCFDCNGVGGKTTTQRKLNRREADRARRARKRAEADAARLAELEAERAAVAEQLAAWRAEHADVVAAVESLRGPFGESLREALEDGPLTERQAATALRVAAEQATEPDPAPVVEGRVALTGTVRGIRFVDTDYGTAVKMTLQDDRGFRVYGTRPDALAGVDVGDRVTLTATVTVSRDDETFGFYKRPTKAARV